VDICIPVPEEYGQQYQVALSRANQYTIQNAADFGMRRMADEFWRSFRTIWEEQRVWLSPPLIGYRPPMDALMRIVTAYWWSAGYRVPENYLVMIGHEDHGTPVVWRHAERRVSLEPLSPMADAPEVRDP
jgi:hypothetical protein